MSEPNVEALAAAMNGVDDLVLSNTQSDKISSQVIDKIKSDPVLRRWILDQYPNVVPDDQTKWTNLYNILKHKSKIQNYHPANSENIRDFLEKLWDDISGSARNLCSWDLEVKPLSDVQYSELVQLKIDFSVKREVELKFQSYDTKLTWNTVSRVKLDVILFELYSNKKPQISSVLEAFGPNRVKKSSEMSVISFNGKWQGQLPLCFFPKTDTEKDKFIDLILRSVYFHALDDKFIQKELSNIPEGEQNLIKFQAEAIKAESRRNHFNDTAEKSGRLDYSSEISVNRSEYIPIPNRARGHGYGARRPRGIGRGSSGGGGARGGYAHGAPSGAGHVTHGGRGSQDARYAPPTPAPQYQQATQGAANRGRGYSRPKFGPVCNYCNYRGHTEDKCRKKSQQQSYGNYGASGNSKVSIEEFYEEDLEEAGVNQFDCDSDFTAFKFNVEGNN